MIQPFPHSSQILADIAALTTELSGYPAAATPPVAGQLTIKDGARYVPDNSAPPRIVWVRKSATFAGAIKNYGALASPASGRALRTRKLVIAAHLWNTSEDTCEDLEQCVLQAVWQYTHGSMEFLGEEWPEQTFAAGTLLVVAFSFQMPILDVVTTLAGPVTEITATPTVTFPDGSEHEDATIVLTS
jgi:hypothetical protein